VALTSRDSILLYLAIIIIIIIIIIIATTRKWICDYTER
jgi:hypothetical protein